MAKTRALLRGLRHAVWWLEGVGADCLRPLRARPVREMLPPTGRRASIELLDAVGLLERGEPFRRRVRVRNRGTHAWSSRGPLPVYLSARWLTRDGDDIGLGTTKVPLPGTLPPGGEAVVPVRLRAPDWLGDFLLEFDLLQQPATPFGESGSARLRCPCRVTGRRDEDIDYFRWYARQDLRRDYWTVVGPRAVEDYRGLGAVKLQYLIDLGLRPDSRVLDVGCGTGLLTQALEGYLSDRGLYYGADIGKEAVEFCRARFRRTNFFFLQNGMTSLPIEGVAFDFVIFYSVFTHTFPEETALLLAEARRLLADGGVIFADVFTSPMVERFSGNRAAVEVNPEYFRGLVGGCGLRAEDVLAQPWGRFGRRVFLKFTPDPRPSPGGFLPPGPGRAAPPRRPTTAP